jgi:hypothetical protein
MHWVHTSLDIVACNDTDSFRSTTTYFPHFFIADPVSGNSRIVEIALAEAV